MEYYYDLTKDTLFRRSAVYGQAMSFEYSPPRAVLENVSDVHFQYVYFTDKEPLYSVDILDALPASVEVTIKFSERGGERAIEKTIDLPLGGSS